MPIAALVVAVFIAPTYAEFDSETTQKLKGSGTILQSSKKSSFSSAILRTSEKNFTLQLESKPAVEITGEYAKSPQGDLRLTVQRIGGAANAGRGTVYSGPQGRISAVDVRSTLNGLPLQVDFTVTKTG